MTEREGRGVMLYLLLDVPSDDEAREIGDELGQLLGGFDDRVIGYALGEVEPVDLTFEE